MKAVYWIQLFGYHCSVTVTRDTCRGLVSFLDRAIDTDLARLWKVRADCDSFYVCFREWIMCL